MTIDHPVRRLLARVCSAETMSRVVDPTLADMRWEDRRPRWRGYLTLASALTTHVVTSMPSAVGRAWTEDGGAIPRIVLLSAAAALLFATPLMAPSWLEFVNRTGSRLWLTATLLPQALALTLPAALLVAIPLAITRIAPSRRLIRRLIVLSLVYATMTFAIIGWIVPVSNQAFRVESSGMSNLRPGRGEMSLGAMRAEVDRVRSFSGAERIARELEFEYEIRLALAFAAVPLTLLAIAFALWAPGRRHPLIIGCASMALYVTLLFGFERWLLRPLLLHTSANVGTIAWIPNAVLVMLAGVIAAAGRRDAVTVTE